MQSISTVFSFLQSTTSYASRVKEGLIPGSSGKVFATPQGDLSPLQAHIDLALRPNAPASHLIEIDVAALQKTGIEIPSPRQVARNYNMPGGGLEYIFSEPLPAAALRVAW